MLTNIKSKNNNLMNVVILYSERSATPAIYLPQEPFVFLKKFVIMTDTKVY